MIRSSLVEKAVSSILWNGYWFVSSICMRWDEVRSLTVILSTSFYLAKDLHAPKCTAGFGFLLCLSA